MPTINGAPHVVDGTKLYAGTGGDPYTDDSSAGGWATGVDFGQATDPTAIAHVRMPRPGVFEVRNLAKVRLGTTYDRVVQIVEEEHRKLRWVDGELVVDASGVGRAPRDELRARGLRVIGVTITGGANETKVEALGSRGEDWNVSRTLLTQKISSLVFSKQLRLAADLALLNDFLAELQDLQVKISAAGADRIEVAPGADHHADLVFAVALAVWRLSRPRPVIRRFRHDLLNR